MEDMAQASEDAASVGGRWMSAEAMTGKSGHWREEQPPLGEQSSINLAQYIVCATPLGT